MHLHSAHRSWWSGFGSGTEKESTFAPLLNATVFQLMSWFYDGSNMKSLVELDSLVQGVLLADNFNEKCVESFSAAYELGRLDRYMDNPGFHSGDGWKESMVKI